MLTSSYPGAHTINKLAPSPELESELETGMGIAEERTTYIVCWVVSEPSALMTLGTGPGDFVKEVASRELQD